MNTITITADDAKKFRLPKKAIANWFVKDVDSEFATLHRQKEDGTPASNFPKNIYKLFTSVYEEIYKECGGEKLPIPDSDETKKSDTPIEEWLSKHYNVGVRKSKWLVELLAHFRGNNTGRQVLAKVGGEMNFVERVISDTDSKREHGAAYSSIASALRVWEVRLRKAKI